MVVRGSTVGGETRPASTATPGAASSPASAEYTDLTACEPPASTFETAPIIGIDAALLAEPLGDDSGADHGTRARSHEAAAEMLAERGEWQRAYQHMRAAMSLVHLGETPAVEVPEQLRREVDRLRRERAEAREQSRRDSLTATFNRRYLDERLSTLRHDTEGRVCVALLDVDHFKGVNDTYGHATGDTVLRTLAELMRDGLPGEAFCARYGGEEFALVLPGADPTTAVTICERLRARIEQHDWESTAPGLHVTISAGLGWLRLTGDDDHGGSPGRDGAPTAALDHVDELLYVAKRTGRNAVAYREPDGTVRLAGPAAGRRGIAAVARAVGGAPRSRCAPTGTTPPGVVEAWGPRPSVSRPGA